jgi:hypothetical protein
MMGPYLRRFLPSSGGYNGVSGGLLLAFLLLMPVEALAQSTLGDVFCSVVENMHGFLDLFSYIAYLAGAFFIVRAILHFKNHAEKPGDFPLGAGIMMMMGGAFLFSLPTVVGLLINSFINSPDAGTDGVSCSVASAGGGSSLDTMITGFINNITDPFLALINILAYVMGAYMVVRGLIQASRHGIDPRNNSITAFTSNLVGGAMLLSFGSVFDVLMGSLFGTGEVGHSDVLNWDALSSAVGGGDITGFKNAVIAALTFVQIIGALSFLRGFKIIKDAAEGNSQASMAQGLTHLIGGVAAINIFTFVNILKNTLGLPI